MVISIAQQTCFIASAFFIMSVFWAFQTQNAFFTLFIFSDRF